MKKATWRGLHELYDAKNCIDEIQREIENLLKQEKSLNAEDIKRHSDKLVSHIDEIIALINEKNKQIIKDLKEHKDRLIAKEKFLKRHYK